MSEEERKFLEIVDLKKGFGSGETRQEVLRGMNFSVAKGEFCVLLGPSGSKYYQFFTGQTWGEKLNYDLCINTSGANIEDLVKVIAKLVK